jgi:hypothetical protein
VVKRKQSCALYFGCLILRALEDWIGASAALFQRYWLSPFTSAQPPLLKHAGALN